MSYDSVAVCSRKDLWYWVRCFAVQFVVQDDDPRFKLLELDRNGQLNYARLWLTAASNVRVVPSSRSVGVFRYLNAILFMH